VGGLGAFSAERFVTLFAALVAPDENRLRYVNAGHPPIALWSGTREPVWLGSTGPQPDDLTLLTARVLGRS
jgi:serine phosphatase RsbU (regulator of sigma subunit)